LAASSKTSKNSSKKLPLSNANYLTVGFPDETFYFYSTPPRQNFFTNPNISLKQQNLTRPDANRNPDGSLDIPIPEPLSSPNNNEDRFKTGEGNFIDYFEQPHSHSIDSKWKNSLSQFSNHFVHTPSNLTSLLSPKNTTIKNTSKLPTIADENNENGSLKQSQPVPISSPSSQNPTCSSSSTFQAVASIFANKRRRFENSKIRFLIFTSVLLFDLDSLEAREQKGPLQIAP
jgi:hypothetical protein